MTALNAPHSSAAHRALEIYDTTLRDGTQGEGVHMSLGDKLALTQALDWFGVDYIEGGWPGSNPKDEAYFSRVRSLSLTQAKIAAFGSTRRAKLAAEDDENLQKLVSSEADLCTIFGKSWDLHVTDALRVSLPDNLIMIGSSIEFLCRATRKPVFYDAEHFFDGFRANASYALDTVQAAHQAGAQRIILCDTNGGSLPAFVSAAVAAVRQRIPKAVLGIHVHNDGGLAIANTLAAVEAGAEQVQGTINGIGERCGNADLTTAIANLELKLGYKCVPDGSLQRLMEISRLVWERINQVGQVNQPYVGRAAFAHKGGIHVSAVQRNSLTYEHVIPELVGNTRRILVSELSGRSNLQAKLAHRYPRLQDPAVITAILENIQKFENDGYSYEAADASLDLLVRRHVSGAQPIFTLDHYRVHGIGTPDAKKDLVEATVKLTVENQVRLCVAEGNGPVDALSHALRAALTPSFPRLAELVLVDYKVRVVNSSDGTAAKVRVLIEHRYGDKNFGTIGVNESIIEASWQALVEAIEYTLGTDSVTAAV